ncbi:MAG TPA: HdeD family acid-resistance protein [Chloroflexota bacterium]
MMMDLEASSRHWWAFALRGLAAVLFGILAFVWPGVTLAALVLLWGAYALVDGVLSLVAAVRTDNDHRWGLLLEGIVGIAAGLVAFFYPGITALVLLYLIAAWALITGVLELIAAVRLRRVIQNEWWLVLSGIASILFAIILLAAPGAGALAVVWLIASYAILFGVLMLGLAYRLYGAGQRRQAVSTA